MARALSLQSQSCLTSPERNTQELIPGGHREELPSSEPFSFLRITFLAQLQRSLAFHSLVSNPFGQGSQISYLWDRVGLLPKLAQGEGLMPGIQGDFPGTQGNPVGASEEGSMKLASASLSCVP